MRGSARSARAIVTRWRCPPDSFTPRSPITVSRPSGKRSENSVTYAWAAASSISASVAAGRAKRRFSRIVPSKRKSSWNTRPSCSRYVASLTSLRSTPSTRTRPASGSRKLAARPAIVDFPDPELPTSATTVPGVASKETPVRTGLSSS